MAVIHKKSSIILTDETGKDFKEKMKNPSIEARKRRDAFLRESQKNVKVISKEKGRWVIEADLIEGEW